MNNNSCNIDPYYVIQHRQFGFLNFDLINNGQTLVGTFYDTDDAHILDKFILSKNKVEETLSEDDYGEQYKNSNYYFYS